MAASQPKIEISEQAPPSETLQRHGVVHWIANRRWRGRPEAMEGPLCPDGNLLRNVVDEPGGNGGVHFVPMTRR